ncbi:E3 ubiquitin-protein ligase COP1-like [Watersipora subatra]|uniref:E3 ubiquitin-protein ligase COP1-like n=1 Tax=Watersipora subatra TaxID=2589382 RepID=UPI00355AF323
MAAEGPTESKRSAQISTRSKGVKRKQPAIFDGKNDSLICKDSAIICSICFNIIECAYMTECGHSFCQKCILCTIEKRNQCPKCNCTLKPDRLYPNFTLNEIIASHKHKISEQKTQTSANLTDSESVDTLTDLLSDNSRLNQHNITALIDLLQEKKRFLLLDTKIGHANLTLEFLNEIRFSKNEELEKLQQELLVISNDISKVSGTVASLEAESRHSQHVSNGDVHTELVSDAAIRQRITAHSSHLRDYYLSMRSQAVTGDPSDSSGLEQFSSALSKFVRYQEFRQLASLNYTSDMYSMYSIVSSIEFDKDADYFAIAGVTKKIKVYDYQQVVRDVVDVHYPLAEMSCASKISCLAWSPYLKNELASSDYEGTVTMWDPFTASKTHVYQEHEKRCWCVDFNKMNPRLMASGSDDSKVKIWSTNSSRSILSIDAQANVCCVKFNPSSSYHLAFGAADHCVHYYDLRKLTEPLLTFKGHLKAVSYAKFLNGSEIVSASTDGQLKLWNVNKGTSVVRTFQGHLNEKNFVGLASDSDFIACGSEDNSLCIYYKEFTKVLHKYKFEVVRSVWQRAPARDEDGDEFVSAVSWKPNSSVIVVANSQGIVKVLKLI